MALKTYILKRTDAEGMGGLGEVSENKKDSRNMHAIILWIVGIIVLIAGVAVATIHGTHLRGSGLGTVLIVIGVLALLIGFLRYFYKK